MADAESRDHGKQDGEGEEEEEVDDTGYKMTKDAVLFCIDVSKSMMTVPPSSDDKKADRDSPTLAALKCAYQLMQQRIISNPKDMMGVLLFGTEQSRFMGDDDSDRGKLAYPHCYLLTDLDVPEAADVKKLRSLVDDEDEAAELLVPSGEPVAMSNVLFCANQIFTTRAANFASRRLFLVTDNDNPHADDKALRQASAVRAKDLYDLGVEIELFPIEKSDSGFDRSKFYDDIVYRALPGDEMAPAPLKAAAKASASGGGISLLQSLISNINSKAAPRRAQFTLPFEIGPGLKIGVKGYNIFKRQEVIRSCYIWMGGEKPQIATGTTTKIAEDTARTVEKVEIRKAFKFGGETVAFTEEELKKIKDCGDPGIRIIGFKDMSLLPFWANEKQSTFIYPADTDYIGSTRVFSALQQKLLAAKKFALVWIIARKNAEPRLAAAVPAEEKYNEDGEQMSPAGLWLVQLPFADDIRKNPDSTIVRAPDSLVDLMRVVIQQLQLPKGKYDPTKYPNPALQWFYRILQATALEEEFPESPEDKTIPRHRQIDKRAGQYIVDWGEELEKQYKIWQQDNPESHKSIAAVGGKRTTDGTAPASKKIKTEGDGAPGEEEMRARFEKNSIGQLTLPVLKSFCLSKRLAVSGKKADLVDRIQGYFESK